MTEQQPDPNIGEGIADEQLGDGDSDRLDRGELPEPIDPDSPGKPRIDTDPDARIDPSGHNPVSTTE